MPGSLCVSHQDSSGGHGTWSPVLAGGCRAAPGQRRDGPAHLWQRSVSLGKWDVLASQMYRRKSSMSHSLGTKSQNHGNFKAGKYLQGHQVQPLSQHCSQVPQLHTFLNTSRDGGLFRCPDHPFHEEIFLDIHNMVCEHPTQ